MNSTLSNRESNRDRLAQLDTFLCNTRSLWQPQPFKQARPAWCDLYPQLTEALLTLDDEQLQFYSDSPESFLPWLVEQLPELTPLLSWHALPAKAAIDIELPGNRFFDGMGGRKRSQIEAFTRHSGQIEHTVVEWCGGKGHLGRLLGRSWHKPVTTLEWDAVLCEAGCVAAEKAGIDQVFHVTDVLQPDLPVALAHQHAVALHACGELHRTLVRHSIKQTAAALDIVPCCYGLGCDDIYQPFTEGLSLQLQKDDMRLAVTETVTAGQREVVQRNKEMAWKLGYIELRKQQAGETGYRNIKPIRKSWLQLSFREFCQQLDQREGLMRTGDADWDRFEQLGWQRQGEVMRLLLLRHSFRRPLELWLVLDMVCALEAEDYQVEYGTFCERQMTPRNIMISARR